MKKVFALLVLGAVMSGVFAYATTRATAAAPTTRAD